MKHSDFVHLHLHSQYSLLDGAIHFDPLLARAERMKMPAIAVTDHGAMFGAMEFYSKAMESGVKPIIGCEVYVAPASRFDKSPVSSRSSADRSSHLVLLAQDEKGYKNLCRLVSCGYTEGYYYKPRIDKQLLEANSGGLIALSACLQGEIAQTLAKDQPDKAEDAADFYNQVFPGRFYLELQDHGIQLQRDVNRKMIELAKKTGLPLVATNDAHYLAREDAEAHDALLCIGTGKLLKDEVRLRYDGDQFYVKSAEEMKALFKEVPSAIKNTIEIAEQCNLSIEKGKYHLPVFPAPGDTNIDNWLEQLAISGLERRFIESAKKGDEFSGEKKERYLKRLKWEASIIRQMGFSGYFLITWDFIKYAREKKIPVGPGRGSAAGSMVAYALRITELDPIEYGLIFERFLNPERISMPDIDIDFCMDRRSEVIDYVKQKYGGESYVTQIITFGAMKAKAVVRDVARVMDMPYAQADKIAKLIPHNLKMTIDKALKEEPRLKSLEKEDPQVEKLLRISRSLEGTARHASTHAAGVVISPKPLIDFMPVFKTNTGEITTQYKMKDIEGLGLLKMDFLGLRTLTVIKNSVDQIRLNHDPEFNIDSIALDDEPTFSLMRNANTLGVFQLESTGMRDLMRKMKPTNFQDIIALVALFRPGPIQSGMADLYVRRKHGHEKVRFDFKELEPILGETYGVPVYQEQVMKIANILAGFSLGEADSLRKAMGKKDMDMMARIREKFVTSAVSRKHNSAKIEKLWTQLEKFGEYGFNKSHSACYALVAYQTAFLKAHFTAEYMAALISSEMDNTDKVIRYIQECRDRDIEITPPDINRSMMDFTVLEGSIRFGLAAIKGIGAAAAKAIISARAAHGEFLSMLDFAESVGSSAVNKRALEALVKCGAFDFTENSRAALFNSVEEVISVAQKTQRDRDIGQVNIFGAHGSVRDDAAGVNFSNAPEWPEKERLVYEKQALGFYISGHPLNEYVSDLRRLANYTTATLENAPNKAEIHIGGMVISRKEKNTKNGDSFAIFTLEDLQGVVEVIAWPKTYVKYIELINGEEPIFITGSIDADEEKGVKIIANEIFPITEAKKKFTNSIHVHIQTPGLEEETLKELKGAFTDCKGASDVILHFRVPGKGELAMRVSGGVSADDNLIGKVERIVGEQSVFLE
ncbi:DNA polymerase III alpha subunit [hydrothermal vent metagenome]|uniref:DNA polymerase III subunit alpha n=1 Tax=hydrothermal vent metagenome TaxID=652676 RepID=A0A3B1CHL6_9ZZZZ